MTQQSFFKVGQIVMIYEDPLTEKKPEGEARLLEHIKTDHYGLEAFQATEDWEVRFLVDGDGGQGPFRTIKRKQFNK